MKNGGVVMVRKSSKAYVLIIVIIIMVSTGLVVWAVWNMNNEKRLEEEYKRELPEMSIQLMGVTLEEVHEQGKRVKYKGSELVNFWHGETEKFYNVELKGHGNTSWGSEKKSYRIKLSKKNDLFGLGKAKKWVLIANNDDDSLLRNDLGLYISRLVGKSPINGRFVLLSINNEDLGVYYLTKALTADKNVMNLVDPYGLLVEFDSAYGFGEELYYETKNGGLLTVKDAVADDNIKVALDEFGKDFDELEESAEKKDYEKIQDLIDVKSFARYFVISEFTGNADAYLTSFYMYKDGINDKIHAGIGWDFDAAFGNRNWGSGEGDFYAPTKVMARREYAFSEGKTMMTRIFYYLIDISEFYELVCDIYQNELMGRRQDVLGRINEMTNIIREEAILDSGKWGKGDFDEEVKYLKWWVEMRFNVFDEICGEKLGLPINGGNY